jgi:hypothetical protein
VNLSAVIYVDALKTYSRTPRLVARMVGERWCHMATDGAIDELHAFAAAMGIPRVAFHAHPAHPHYDLTPERRAEAVARGAVEVGSKELVVRCFRKRGAP